MVAMPTPAVESPEASTGWLKTPAVFRAAADRTARERAAQDAAVAMATTAEAEARQAAGAAEAARVQAEVEAQAAAVYYADRAGYASLAAPPTMEEMLVGGSTAAGILASIFTNEQQPHSVEVASVSLQPPDGLDPHGGGHRRTQRTGDTVYVQVVTHAPTCCRSSFGYLRVPGEGLLPSRVQAAALRSPG